MSSSPSLSPPSFWSNRAQARAVRWWGAPSRWAVGAALTGLLVACGGGSDGTTASGGAAARAVPGSEAAADRPGEGAVAVWAGVKDSISEVLSGLGVSGEPKTATTQVDAVRLAHQASFGPDEDLVRVIKDVGAQRWIAQQMGMGQAVKRTLHGNVVTTAGLPMSKYTSGGTGAVHQHTNRNVDFCADKGVNCWRDWSSTTPLVWDFYRNAVNNPDQLRQRVALALQQLVVISNVEVSGTYGFRQYNNMLLENAFGNYRDVLRKVTLSPLMGDYLDHVNNDKNAPNENFARELLQLFALGTCELNPDGSLKGGTCTPTYDNDLVRAYAFALTGWTYPPGGASPWGCWPQGANCAYYEGDMVPVAAFHNTQPRTLLSNVSLNSGHSASAALDAVLNSLMAHPNIGPFVGRHLIQQLVTSNPSTAYVGRVAAAFNTGKFGNFGTGKKGDLAATVAAVLLDTEARAAAPGASAGRLREPIQLFTGVLRALKGRTDGEALSWWWGEELRQHVFRSPSVFNFYPPDYPVAGTALVGPSFGIHNANTALNRINYLNYLLFWDGSNPGNDIPNPVGTKVDLSTFTADADNPARLVDRLSLLALGEPLPATARTSVINAVTAYATNQPTYKTDRVRQAAFLVFASPQYQLTR